MSRKTHLAFLFHMHQPDYVDPATGKAELPWVRLHGARGYLDLARLLDEYEQVHLTVNFVPSLVRQLEEVVAGGGDRWLDIAMRDASDWTPQDRLFLIQRHFSVNWGRSIDPRPRYCELVDKRGRGTPAHLLHERVGAFSDADLRDLTVLFHLSWIGFSARRTDGELDALERKGRGYDLQDLALVSERQRQACAQVLPLWRKLAARGQVELASSPYYHPIAPLLCDTEHAARSRPDLPLPTRFSFPEDAKLQVELGIASHERVFGVKPVGMWPPEGSVSPEAVAAYSACGISWLATDEGNLWRSRAQAGLPYDRGELHRAHRFRDVNMVFRDRELSDRIGFAYMHGDADAGAEDLLGRARHAAHESRAQGDEPAMVGVFLDGENPWESYHGSGEPFLRAVFGRLSQVDDLRAVTISEHLGACPDRGALPQLHSGSWIDSDFHIWIGDPVKNRAWDLLAQARRRVEERRARGDVEVANAALARILPAEGSDWFWWFGGPFSSAEDPIFDRLFRAHLEATYRALGEPSPAALADPVDDGVQVASAGAGGLQAPTALIRPAIGREPGVRGYFAWLGAGVLDVPRGAAMAELPLLERIRFGFDRKRLVLRLEATAQRVVEIDGADIDIEIITSGRRFQVRLGTEARWHLAEARDQAWSPLGHGEPAERETTPTPAISLGVPWERLRATPGSTVSLVIRVIRGALVLARYPADSSLQVNVPGDEFEADHWSV